MTTLKRLADEGIDKETIEAAVNSMEFALRENNTGAFPRGIALMFRSMRTWLYGGDPLEPLQFEGPLAALKQDLAAGKRVFEDLVRLHLVDNRHRTTVLLKADTGQAAREAAEERARLDAAEAAMTPEQRAEVTAQTERLKSCRRRPTRRRRWRRSRRCRCPTCRAPTRFCPSSAARAASAPTPIRCRPTVSSISISASTCRAQRAPVAADVDLFAR